MKKMFLVVLLLGLSVPAQVHAFGCEKWKSEIAGTVKDLALYMKAYHDRSNGRFAEKSSELIGKLRKIKDRVESVSSCTDDVKYENRRLALIKALNIALPVMKAGELLDPGVRESLGRHEE